MLINIMFIYADDVIIIGKSRKGIEEVARGLKQNFALKDLGDFNFFLGIQVIKNQDIILLFQAKYVQDLLAKVELTNYKGIKTPFST